MGKTKDNNIGFLRLVLASLVIVGHAPEMIDGDRRREPLTAIFHTVSLGGLAVDGFFLLSGYLITMSMLSTVAVMPFMMRRFLRIWPGYLAAFLISVFCLSPLLGGIPWDHLGITLASLVAMRDPPYFPGQLKGLPYPTLNGSMWTIAYEFRCYVMVALMYTVGLLRRRWLCLGIGALLIACSVAATLEGVAAKLDAIHPFHLNFIFGDLSQTVHLSAVFVAGVCAFLFRNEASVWCRGSRVAACALATTLLMFVPFLAEAGLTIFGGVVLFWLGFVARLGVLQRINDRWDISYGTYLYGWPVGITILYFQRGISPGALAGISLVLSWACGAASWWGLEKRAKGLLPHRQPGSEATYIDGTSDQAPASA